MKLNDFDYFLPKELIAQRPTGIKKNSKLLITKNKKIIDFNCIYNSLSENDFLVFNDTKVMPVVLKGEFNKKDLKITLIEKEKNNIWKAFLKPSRKVNINEEIIFHEGLSCVVIKKKSTIAYLKFNFSNNELLLYIKKFGNLPLPPYVKSKPNRELDEKKYQTVFAKNDGAIASPTAGLHFDSDIIESLKHKNIEFVFITLHVGIGTFFPLSKDNVKDNVLHKEKGIISNLAAKKINRAIKKKKNIVSVGTTVLRLLESCYNKYGNIQYFNEYTDLFIYPGFKFQVVNKLLTNFHLPKSSLLILVSAFAGKKNVKEFYNQAIEKKMKFFSFGDVMLVEKNEF